MKRAPIQARFILALNDELPARSVTGSVRALLGYAGSDFLSAKRRLQDLIHPGDAEIVANILSARNGKRTGDFNIRLRHADGRIRCIKGRYTKGPGRAGEQPFLTLVLTNACTVKEPGDARLMADYGSLIEHSTDFLYLKNRNHVVLAASKAMPGVTESAKTQSQLVGKTDYDLHPEEMADIYYKLEQTAIAEVRRVNQIQQLRAQDGSIRWIDNRKYPISGPQGECIGIFGVAPDITEYVTARERLHESEERLRDAQEIAGLSSYVLDIPNRQWTISPPLAALLGIGSDYERSFESIWPLIHPDDRPAMAERFQQYFRGEKAAFDSEYRIVRHVDGAVRWVHTRGRLEVDAGGKPLALKGTILDITASKLAEAALREREELLQLFIAHAPAALAMFDETMRYLAASRRWLEMHGLAGKKILGHSHYEIFPEISEEWRDEHRRAMAGERLGSREGKLVRQDGTVQWVRREILPWRTASGSVGGIVIFSEDITAEKQAEERLRLAASVFTGAREGITITDPEGNILDVNDAFTRITGYTREEVLGQNPRILKSGLQSKEFYENMWRCITRDGHWSGEIWNRSKSGDIYAEMLTIDAIRNPDGKVTQYIALFSDITEIKEKQLQLERVARYDALTGLPNRALFADRLRQAMAHARRNNQLLAVAYFDLDGFKEINDRYGHTVGDGLLTAKAFRMKRVMREGDTLARLGGDEFVAVMLDLNGADSVTPAMNRLLQAAAEEAQIGEIFLRISASAGLTFYPQTEDVDADVLIRQAGQAMYQAKLAGKNRYHCFDPGQDQITRSRHEDIEHIRQALAAREFVLHYQPKVNMRTGKVVGVEVLIRWRHPERGLLPPGLFLPVIEEHPLIVELGEWMTEAVLAQMEAWQDAGLDLPVSINVSALELQQPHYAERLRARLQAHSRISPSSLELEVLETSALQDMVQTSRVLQSCREIGVQIGLDDFGTGYSSLTYLKRLPANTLKIDQSFVRDILEDPENLTILEGVLGLAAAFRLGVIAEGVESVEHGLMLLQMGCELAQGYGIARPMPGSEVHEWIRNWRPDQRWANVPPVHAGNRPLLYAYVEHRAWLAAFEAFLQGKRITLPPLDASQCRIGAWLDGERQSAYGLPPEIQAIETLHRQCHDLALEIDRLRSENRTAEGLARLGKLHHLHDRCLSRLKNLSRFGSGKTGKSSVRGRDATTARIGTE